jgi:uncharacterized protein (TIGR01589 family)
MHAQVVFTLQQQAKVEPGFTALVWQKLEEQNPDFFAAYYTRLKLKDQIVLFNHLLEQQVAMFQKMSRQYMTPAGARACMHAAAPHLHARRMRILSRMPARCWRQQDAAGSRMLLAAGCCWVAPASGRDAEEVERMLFGRRMKGSRCVV